MATIHFILQGKGGVGKSLVSYLLMQYFMDKGQNVIAVDTDPVNASFTSYKRFEVHRIELLDEYQNFNSIKFDELVELILNNPDKNFVIDNGATSFLPLSAYLNENSVIELLKSKGFKVIIHTIITGGSANKDTLQGFYMLGLNMNTKIAVWLNEYFGKVETIDMQNNSKSFEETKAYKEYSDKVLGIFNIKKMSPLFEQDFRAILERHLTFSEALESEDFSFMSKNRISILKEKIYTEFINLENALAMSEDNDN